MPDELQAMKIAILAADGGRAGRTRAAARGRGRVGVICHGPWTLVEADLVGARTLTSYPSQVTDEGAVA